MSLRNSILTSGYFFKIYFALFSFGSKLRAQLGLKPLFLEDQSNATTAMTTTNVQKKGGETSSNRRVSSLLNSCGNNDRHYIYFQGGLIWSVLASLPSFYYPIWGEGRREELSYFQLFSRGLIILRRIELRERGETITGFNVLNIVQYFTITVKILAR